MIDYDYFDRIAEFPEPPSQDEIKNKSISLPPVIDPQAWINYRFSLPDLAGFTPIKWEIQTEADGTQRMVVEFVK